MRDLLFMSRVVISLNKIVSVMEIIEMLTNITTGLINLFIGVLRISLS